MQGRCGRDVVLLRVEVGYLHISIVVRNAVVKMLGRMCMAEAVAAKLARSMLKMVRPCVVHKSMYGFQCGAESRAFERQMKLQRCHEPRWLMLERMAKG